MSDGWSKIYTASFLPCHAISLEISPSCDIHYNPSRKVSKVCIILPHTELTPNPNNQMGSNKIQILAHAHPPVRGVQRSTWNGVVRLRRWPHAVPCTRMQYGTWPSHWQDCSGHIRNTCADPECKSAILSMERSASQMVSTIVSFPSMLQRISVISKTAPRYFINIFRSFTNGTVAFQSLDAKCVGWWCCSEVRQQFCCAWIHPGPWQWRWAPADPGDCAVRGINSEQWGNARQWWTVGE